MEKQNINKNRIIFFGIFSIAYAVLGVIIGYLDYWHYDDRIGVLSNFQPETMMQRIPALFFSIFLAFGGYCFITGRKEYRFLFNFAFWGFLFEYPYTFLYSSISTLGSFLHFSMLNFLFAVTGILYINRKRLSASLNVNFNKRWTGLLIPLVLSVTIIGLYGYKDSVFNSFSKREQWKNTIGSQNTCLFQREDSCFYRDYFYFIIDSLDDMDSWDEFEICQIDSMGKNIYSEQLYLEDVFRSNYYYDDSGRVVNVKFRTMNWDIKSMYSTLDYYRNEYTKTSLFITTRGDGVDTNSSHYDYFMGGTMLLSSPSDSFNNNFIVYLNSSGLRDSMVQTKGEQKSIYCYQYDSKGRLIATKGVNSPKFGRSSVEWIYYVHNRKAAALKKEYPTINESEATYKMRLYVPFRPWLVMPDSLRDTE